jgi:hypothetical protein
LSREMPDWLIPNETAQSAPMISLPIHGFFAFLPIAMPPTSAEMTAPTEAPTMSTAEASTMSTTEASAMSTTEASASTVATASSTMCERGGRHARQDAGHNQTKQ